LAEESLKYKKALLIVLLVVTAFFGFDGGCSSGGGSNVPANIRAIFDKALYSDSIWGLRVVDLDTGKVLINYKPDYDFYIGSVRKIFTVGELLNQIGPDHLFVTPIYKDGKVDDSGVLDGNLILVASGDISMGGRTTEDGHFAITDFDHNEASSFGNAELTKPDPLNGYKAIAEQIAAAGITQVDDVVIDDRLWVPFPFRGEFDLRPIFVNDDCVDLIMNPSYPGMNASVDWRPKSAALGVVNDLVTSGTGTELTLELDPPNPGCIGQPGCTAGVAGQLPVDFVPPFTNEFPLVQTFRITEPQNYARTVLIELLKDAGVTVLADPVAQNPVAKLPPKNSYSQDDLVTSFVSFPYADYAKLINKVSYNLGANATFLLWGNTQGVDNMDDALAAERELLKNVYGIPGGFSFINGDGGGETTARNEVVTKWLQIMTEQPAFDAFFDSLPILAVDGSLVFVDGFLSDPTLTGAKGQVHAKTGTYAAGDETGFIVKGEAFSGYIDTKSGMRLVYHLVVNNVQLNTLLDILEVIQDEGTISAILWRDY
jgi:D-alanyl-D-alanine carboxypeptidase